MRLVMNYTSLSMSNNDIEQMAGDLRRCMMASEEECLNCPYLEYDDICSWEMMRNILLCLEAALYGDNTDNGGEAEDA